MYVELECQAETDEGIFCTFLGEVEADNSAAGIIKAVCPVCGYESEWDDDSGTNPAEL